MTTKSIGPAKALFAGLVMLAGVAPAGAQEATNLGTFTNWTVWRAQDSSGTLCYISSQPQSTQPANVRRDPIHFLVVMRKGLGTRNEVQSLLGYPLASEPLPTAEVDGRSYNMLPEGEAAWLASEADESSFVAALKAGSRLIVKGRSQRGTNTSDTYSLSGVTAAITEMEKACA
ncbi:MAG: invasion associated locus B family protein [Devosia sp.]